MKEIFISYSRKDTAIADRICAALDEQGISYFIDRKGIGGGMEFPDVLADGILECRIMLFLASKNSYNSKYTKKEITFAFNEKPSGSILPYIIDGSRLPNNLRFTFADVNIRTLQEHPIETILMQDLCQLLGRKYISYEKKENEIITEVKKKDNVKAEKRNTTKLLLQRLSGYAHQTSSRLWMMLLLFASICGGIVWWKFYYVPLPIVPEVVADEKQTDSYASDTIPFLRAKLDSIVNNFAADATIRLSQIIEAKKLESRIQSLSSQHGIEYDTNNLLVNQIEADFNAWVEAGDNNPITSVKISCYETALQIKHDSIIVRKLMKLKK